MGQLGWLTELMVGHDNPASEEQCFSRPKVVLDQDIASGRKKPVVLSSPDCDKIRSEVDFNVIF